MYQEKNKENQIQNQEHLFNFLWYVPATMWRCLGLLLRWLADDRLQSTTTLSGAAADDN